MGLSSFFKRGTGASAPRGEPTDEVQRARTRARQRLIGAMVLLAIGIVGFPLVFETQPRPIPVDIPIEIPRKDGAPPLTVPPARGSAATIQGSAPLLAAAPSTAGDTPSVAANESAPRAPAGDASRGEEIITESREEAAGDAPPAVDPHRSPKPATAPTAVKPAPGAKPASDAHRPSDDGERARALLDGQPPAKPDAAPGRFVVQVGAFADAAAAQDTRMKIEKLGLKTYTQVANTAGGNRIRVRLGPFASRDEADKALTKARGAGLAAVVLTL